MITTNKIAICSIQKLLTLARLSTDKLELKMEDIDIGEIISESVRLLSPLAEQRGISIDIAPVTETFVIRGNRESLLALFTNLLDNSIKYNVHQGEIYISTRKEAGFIVCAIKDTGIGIPEEALNKVFDRFYRVDKSRSKESGGSGMDLSICHEIVKLHGGKINIKSRLGSGTNVSVYLKEGKDDT